MKGATMRTRITFGFIVMMVVLAFTANAGARNELQKYFNDAATKVKATEIASEKRAILNESFQTISKALELAQSSPSFSNEDAEAVDRYKSILQEKQDELSGNNGFVRVSDEQLDAFSDYVVQDMEQADAIISISLVALLLIIILVVLIMK